MDRFDALLAFARVVEAGSFTKAAQTLHLSKTTVTQLVQQLEARLRVKLLHRTTRQVRVTEDGAAYYERVVRLLADLEDADTSLSDASAALRGRLRVDVPSPFAQLVLVPALPEFHAQHPDIQLDLGVSDRMVDVIRDNVDCVVRGGELTDSTLIARRVGELRLGVFAAPSYLARSGIPTHPLELEDSHHRVVGYLSARTGRILPMRLQRGEETVQVQGRTIVSVDDGVAYLAAGVAGMGVLWLPHYMAQQPLRQGALQALFDGWQIQPMPMQVVYPPHRHVSAKLRAFIAWIELLMARQVQLPLPAVGSGPSAAPGSASGPAASHPA